MGFWGDFFTYARPENDSGERWPKAGSTRVRWGTPQVWIEGGYKDIEGLSPEQRKKVRKARRLRSRNSRPAIKTRGQHDNHGRHSERPPAGAVASRPASG